MKKTLLSVLFVSLFFMSQMLVAQIHVDSEGRVGIGTTTPNTISKLDIQSGLATASQKLLNIGYTGSNSTNHIGIYSLVVPQSGLGWGYGGYLTGGYLGVAGYGTGAYGGYSNTRYGVYGKAAYGNDNRAVYGTATTNVASSNSYGIYGIANATSGNNYGVYGYASSNASYDYAVCGYTSGSASTVYAGYFTGKVHIIGNLTVTGTVTPNASDEKLKDNIQPIESELDKIKKINVKTFQYKDDKKYSLPIGKKYGFIAQEIEKLFPETVTEVSYPYQDRLDQSADIESGDSKEQVVKTELVSYKAIYYDQFIPLLTKSIQEQQEIIEKQQATIDDLLKRVEKLEIKQ